MNRILTLFCIGLLTTCILLPPASAQQQGNSREDAIAQRLDEILKRLESIEARLATLETQVKATKRWLVDERGILRDLNGRPIGFWGIDGGPPELAR